MADLPHYGQVLARHPGVFAVIAATILFAAAYALVFALTGTVSSIGNLAQNVLVNSVTSGLLGGLCLALLRGFVLPRSAIVQAAAHLVLGPLYSIIWYLSIISIFGYFRGSAIEGFSVRAFNIVPFVWQAFQGIAVYGIVAAGAYALWYRDRLIAAEAKATDPKDAPRRRLLIRTDDEFANVDADTIVWIAAQDDYSELVTDKRRVLIRKSLGAMEAMLPDDRFLRVHRSAIVNLDAVEQVEPAGNGRLSLHMKNGETVTSSRAGAKALRERTL